MRFVPHRTARFQYSSEEIPEDYDSGYSSDSSLKSENEKFTRDEWVNSTDLQVTTLSDILDDLQINERFQIISESALLLDQENSVASSSLNKFFKSLIQSQTQTQLESDDHDFDIRKDQYTQLLSIETKEIENMTLDQFSKLEMDVQNVIKEVEDERRRKQEEERLRLIEEARRKAEEERLRKEEEEKKKREEEIERQRLKLELERKLKEAEEERKKKEIEDAKRQKEEELKKLELERSRLEEEKKLLALNQVGLHNEVRIQKEFLKYKQDIADIKQKVVEPLLANKELKQLTNKIRRRINPKFGQLTNSRNKLMTVCNEIMALVTESINLNELSYNYILNFIGKELIKQAELEVTVSPQHAVPLGLLASFLLQMLPDLSYYLLARFYKKCPYLIGFTCAIDTEEGRMRMGWRRSNNKWEDESKYNERVGGIATLYSVMTRFSIDNNTPCVIPMSKSWVFVSRMLNIKPELLQDVHYIIMANWWEACCKEFLDTYGGQARKLIHLMSTDWLQVSEGKKFSGYVRLRLLAEEWLAGRAPTSFKLMDY